MCSETSDDREALREHADALRDEAGRARELPHRLLGYVDDIAREAGSADPDRSRISAGAHGILQWYLDQGFAGVPLHAQLAALAHEALRYAGH
jgi:hypothetical protein